MSKRHLDAKTRYPELEKLPLALVVASRKLRPYFHTHSIEVLTNYPLRQVLQKLEPSSRLLKWAIELGQFDVSYCLWTTIKGQALADLIAKFTCTDTTEVTRTTSDAEATKVVETWNGENSITNQEETNQWVLYVDDASNENGFEASMMLINPKGHKIHCAPHFGFSVSNNEAEYEALIAGLCLARELRVGNLKIYRDSQLVVNQLNDVDLVRGERIAAYLQKA